MTRTPDYSARRPLRLGAGALVLLVAGFGLWATKAEIAGAVLAPGQVEAEAVRRVLQHPEGGVVAAVLVAEGDRVEAGAPLIRLEGGLLASELAIVESQFFELLARRGRLEAERDGSGRVAFAEELTEAARARPDIAELTLGQETLFDARAESLAAEIDQLARRLEQIGLQILGIDAQQEALARQAELTERERADQAALFAKGLAPSARMLALEREAARLAGQQGELAAARAETEGRLTEIRIEMAKLGRARREEALTLLRDLGYRELELAERRRALRERMALLEIRAPVAGIVHAMQVTTARAVLRAAEPVLTLVPQDLPPVIAARIDPIHIDEVHIGQVVTLRFAAFDSRTAPELSGRVTRLSADALRDPQGRGYYRAEIALDPQELARLGGHVLVPGMPVEVFLRTGERSPLAYLIQPLAAYFNRAFRES